MITQLKRAFALAGETVPVLRGSVVPAGKGDEMTIEVRAGKSWRKVDSARLARGGAYTVARAPPGVYRTVYRGLDGPSVVVPVVPRRASLRSGAMPGPLLAVDAPFVLYRSFFALPDSIHGSGRARPVNALLGATNLLLRIAADRGPRAIVLCFGAEAAPYRVELFPSYHADRPPVPGRARLAVRARA